MYIKMKEYSRSIVRISISLVFLWFGINQIFFPSDFMGYLPDFLLSLDYADKIVMLNGFFELIFGILLIVGYFTKWVALILSLHLFSITLSLGYNDIAIRDFGLALVTLSIFLGGADKWCLDMRKKL